MGLVTEWVEVNHRALNCRAGTRIDTQCLLDILLVDAIRRHRTVKGPGTAIALWDVTCPGACTRLAPTVSSFLVPSRRQALQETHVDIVWEWVWLSFLQNGHVGSARAGARLDRVASISYGIALDTDTVWAVPMKVSCHSHNVRNCVSDEEESMRVHHDVKVSTPMRSHIN